MNHLARDGEPFLLNQTVPVTSTNEVPVSVNVGDRVYVDPSHGETSRTTAGLAGIIDRLEGDRARVIFGKAEDAHASEVPLRVLRHDRRVARRPLRQMQS